MNRGRPPKPRRVGVVRELTQEDLAQLQTGAKRTLPAVARFRDSHHKVARLFAFGLRHAEVAAETGYSLARLYSLTADPSFQQLIAEKREDVDDDHRVKIDEYMAYATANMLKAERMLADKLDKADAEDEPLPTRDLIAISRDAADRFGYGKKSLSVNLNADFATMLERAVKRTTAVIEGTTGQVLPFTQPPQNAARKLPAPAVPSLTRRV